MVSFRGKKKSLGHAQIGLLEGFNSKFQTSISTAFICGVPPAPPGALMWKWEVLCWSQVYRTEHYKLVKTTNISRHVISRVTSQSVLSGYNFWQAKPAAWEKASVGKWQGLSIPLPRSRFLSCTARAWLFALQWRYISTNWRPCLRDTISAVTPLL